MRRTTKGIPKPVVDHGALLALYAAGASVADVAIELRCSVVTVRRTVHKAGLPCLLYTSDAADEL